MSELQEAAAGESQVRAFVRAWRVYAQEHGLVYPEPKLCAEKGLCVARFDGQNVSVTHWSSRARIANVAEWMTEEALSHWTPIALTDDLSNELSVLVVASVLDRRIPW